MSDESVDFIGKMTRKGFKDRVSEK
jgi:hypothetical protein